MILLPKRENQLDWVCRILMVIDVLTMAAGYLFYFKTKRQLISPLIPQSTINQILVDNNEILMKASLISGGLFLAGLWLYSFNKKIPAAAFFSLTPVFYKILLFIL